jgi:hypothetical protein
MKSTTNNQLYFLKKAQSVHWCLFGVNGDAECVYLLEVIGNESTKTEVLSKQEARRAWQYYRANGFKKIELIDAGGIPHHLDQRIREWWKFVHRGFKDKNYMDDPWGTCTAIGNDSKTLSDIAEGKYSIARQDDTETPYANFWEYREPDDEEAPDGRISEDDREDDNYWNREGVFESESDKDDENLDEIDSFDEQEHARWVPDRDEAYQQQQEESYQQWAMEEEQRNDEMEEAIEKFYRSQEH